MLAPSLLLACLAQAVAPGPPAPLELVASIPLPRVAGRIDHLAFDAKRGRLHVAALENGTLEVLDLAAGRVARTLTDLGEPQGVLFLPALDQLFLTQGARGALDVYSGESLELVQRLKLSSDPDNLRCDAAAGQVWVAYGQGMLAWLDARERTATARVRLPGHPEAFALEPDGPRVFANVPSERSVLVVDRARKEVVASWPIESAQANYPMLLVAEEKHLFVGCRNPGKLVVLDTDAGKEVVLLELSGDVDDLWYDEARGRIYASCGAGTIDVFTRRPPGNMWKRTSVLETRQGARTSLFVPETGRLYLAVPRADEREAEVRVYAARD